MYSVKLDFALFQYPMICSSLNLLFFTLSSSFRNFVASENPV